MHCWSVRFWPLVSLLLGMSACDPATSTAPLRLTMVTWTGYAPLYVARDLHFYPPRQLDLVTLNTSIDTSQAFLQRRTDFLAGSLFDVLRLIDQGADCKIVLVLDHSHGADGIAARPGIASVRDLKGQRVAVEIGTMAQYTLLRALTRAGLTETDVTIVNLPLEDSLTAMQQQRVDAAALWEPFLTRAQAHGMGTIFTSREIPGEIIDVLIIHSALASTRSKDVVGLLSAWEKAVQALRTRQQDATQAATRFLGMTEAALQASLAGVELPDLASNRRLFDPANKPYSVWEVYARTAEFMVQHKLLKHPPPAPAALFEARFVAQTLAR
jgi:NitT/TauT family transport system substrate-binding protein